MRGFLRLAQGTLMVLPKGEQLSIQELTGFLDLGLISRQMAAQFLFRTDVSIMSSAPRPLSMMKLLGLLQRKSTGSLSEGDSLLLQFLESASRGTIIPATIGASLPRP